MKKYNRRGKYILIIFISVLLIAVQSCVDDKYDLSKISDEIEINPGLAAPVARGSLSLDDIVNEISSENMGKFPDDSLLYITFTDTFKSYLASDVIDIPDQTFVQLYIDSDINLNPEWTGSGIGDTIQFSKQKNGEFTVSHNEKIDSIKLKTTTLQIHVSSTFKHRGIVNIFTNSIKTNGQPLMNNIPISNAAGTFDTTINIPLNNTTIYLDNSNPSLTILPLSFELYLINSGSPVLAGESCDITMSFEDIQFSNLFGYLGEYDLFDENGQMDLGIYEDILGDGELLFADPRFSFFTYNSFGIPVEVTLSNVSAFSEKNNITTPITFTGVNPFDISAPDMSQIGKTVKDSILINKDNCNIKQAMETSPKTFSYNIIAKSNPAGPTGPYNFVTDSSKFNVDFEIVLPLWIKANDIVLSDTTDLDIEKEIGDFIDYINYFRITMEGSNGFPMEAGLQVIFTDSAYTVLDSLFLGSPIVLNPAMVDSYGKVTRSVQFKKIVEFSKEKLSGIKNTKRAIVRATLNTSNIGSGQYVKFYSYYIIDFKLSVKTNVTINSRDLND